MEAVRNWQQLPWDVMVLILSSLNTVDILTKAQLVCRWWRCVSRDPALWKTVDMRNFGTPESSDLLDLEKMCHNALRRGSGCTVEIIIGDDAGTDRLLKYIASRARGIKRLRLISCRYVSEKGFVRAVEKKFPSLEELEITSSWLSLKSVVAVGVNCPHLKSLRLNRLGPVGLPDDYFPFIDIEAYIISNLMPNLRRLQAVGNCMSEDGVQAILDGCPLLESLDLRRCSNIDFERANQLMERCIRQVTDLKLPFDPIEGGEFVSSHDDDNDDINNDKDDEDYSSSNGSFSSCHYGDDDDDNLRSDDVDDEENYCYHEDSDSNDYGYYDPNDHGSDTD